MNEKRIFNAINFSMKVSMKKKLSIIFGSIFAFSVTYGNQNVTAQTNLFTQSERCPNNIYFGPEAFVFDLKTDFKGMKAQGTKFFVGLKLGYEYLKPKSFYFGTDLLL